MWVKKKFCQNTNVSSPRGGDDDRNMTQHETHRLYKTPLEQNKTQELISLGSSGQIRGKKKLPQISKKLFNFQNEDVEELNYHDFCVNGWTWT